MDTAVLVPATVERRDERPATGADPTTSRHRRVRTVVVDDHDAVDSHHHDTNGNDTNDTNDNDDRGTARDDDCHHGRDGWHGPVTGVASRHLW